MNGLLVLAIGWTLIGFCIAWLIGGVSRGEAMTTLPQEPARLVLLEGGNPGHGGRGGIAARERTRKSRIGELQLLVSAARQSGCNPFFDDVSYRPGLCRRPER